MLHRAVEEETTSGAFARHMRVAAAQLDVKFVNGKSSQVNTLPKAKSKTRSKQNKDMHTCSSVYSERGVPLPVLTSGGE